VNNCQPHCTKKAATFLEPRFEKNHAHTLHRNNFGGGIWLNQWQASLQGQIDNTRSATRHFEREFFSLKDFTSHPTRPAELINRANKRAN